MNLTRYVLILQILLLVCSSAAAEFAFELDVPYKETVQKVYYDFYYPKADAKIPAPVIICVDGLNSKNGEYIHSGTQRCEQYFKTFADNNNFTLLSLGFLFVPEHWPTKESYQYAQAWSGNGLLGILDKLSKQYPIDTSELYLFGISAGAQFCVRFAQLRPELVKAVAAHAAGGYDEPKGHIPTKFLITVGEKDTGEISRIEFALQFTQAAKKHNIDTELKVIPGLGHAQTAQQNQFSKDFFLKIKNND